MLLGVKRFSKIAVAASTNKIMATAVEGYGLSPGELWLHSIAVFNYRGGFGEKQEIG